LVGVKSFARSSPYRKLVLIELVEFSSAHLYLHLPRARYLLSLVVLSPEVSECPRCLGN